MKKLILQNDAPDIDMTTFLLWATHVVGAGRVSNNGRQYCYLTSFLLKGSEYHIVSDLNKKSDKLILYKVPEKKQ